MTKNLILPLCLAAMMAFPSCEEVSLIDEAGQTGLVDVQVAGHIASTKVALEGVTPTWEDDDQVAFFTTDGTLCPVPFTIDEGGSPSAAFSGQKPSGSSLAWGVYPYSSDVSWSGGSIGLNLPTYQDGKGAEAFMIGGGSENDGFLFSNACCLVKINIPADRSICRVEVVRDDRVTGAFSINPGTLAVTSGAIQSHLERRSIVADTDGISGEVILAVLPSSSDRIEMAFTKPNGKVAFASSTFSSGNPFERGRIKNVGTLPRLSYSDAALIADPTSSQL